MGALFLNVDLTVQFHLEARQLIVGVLGHALRAAGHVDGDRDGLRRVLVVQVVVGGRRDPTTIRTVDRSHDRIDVPGQGLQKLSRRCVPHAYRVVPARDDSTTVGAEGSGLDKTVVALQRLQSFARGHVP